MGVKLKAGNVEGNDLRVSPLHPVIFKASCTVFSVLLDTIGDVWIARDAVGVVSKYRMRFFSLHTTFSSRAVSALNANLNVIELSMIDVIQKTALGKMFAGPTGQKYYYLVEIRLRKQFK